MALTYQSNGQKTYVVMFGDEKWGFADICQYLKKECRILSIPMFVPVIRKNIMARHWNN